MNYFFDTEFIDLGNRVELVSIGIVREDGRTFYAESTCYDKREADEWLHKNVFDKLYLHKTLKLNSKAVNPQLMATEVFGDLAFIESEILEWFGSDENIRMYAYYASHDWTAFCSIFGRMMNVPSKFGMYPTCLKNLMDFKGLTTEWKQATVPDPTGEHNALVDAKWNVELYKAIQLA